jgi:hypothetical protein
MTGIFMAFVVLGLIDGDAFHSGQWSQSWNASSPDFHWLLVFRAVVVLLALFVIAMSFRRKDRWWSTGGWIIGIVVSDALGFLAGIGVLDQYVLRHW